MDDLVCSVCKKPTVCQAENTLTGEVTHVFDKCRDCLIESSFTFNPIKEQIMLISDIEDEKMSPLMQGFKDAGLLGCFDGSGVNSESYKMEWISVKNGLPKNKYTPEIEYYWVYDGNTVFLSEWDAIDCDYEKFYHLTGGYWFCYIDGTECRSAHENITHWMEVEYPVPPKDQE